MSDYFALRFLLFHFILLSDLCDGYTDRGIFGPRTDFKMGKIRDETGSPKIVPGRNEIRRQ